MSLTELKKYRQKLQDEGKTLSTSKELGKVEDLIKTKEPEKYGEETVSSAYKKLSRGVTEYGGWTEANIENIKEHTGEYPLLVTQNKGKSASDLPGYLQNFQETAYQAAGSPELRESIIQQIEPEGMERPEPLDRVETFEEMREEYGVADMETTLNDLKSQKEEIIATARQRQQAAEGEPVALGVIGGRVSEIERQTNERIDAINRQINTVTDQLQTSYGVIETYMNLMGQDYRDAVDAYNTEFNRNLQVYKLVDEEMDEQQASARSNLQLYMNAITSGNIDYDSLSKEQKVFINKMEVQSGLPLGFTSKLKADNADGKVLSTTTRTTGGGKYVDVVMQMPDGSMKVQSQYLGASGTGDSGLEEEDYARDMTSVLSQRAGADGKVSPSTWNQAIGAWRSETGESPKEFAEKFGNYVNTSHSEDYFGYSEAYGGGGSSVVIE